MLPVCGVKALPLLKHGMTCAITMQTFITFGAFHVMFCWIGTLCLRFPYMMEMTHHGCVTAFMHFYIYCVCAIVITCDTNVKVLRQQRLTSKTVKVGICKFMGANVTKVIVSVRINATL
jgi:hypothetical protein